MKMIYLDYAATTPVDPRVADKMQYYLTKENTFGNASSTHAFGQAAKKAVEQARHQTAALIEAEPSEIIFTSGATEANNLALKGVASLYQHKGKHIVTLKTEHPSVLETCQFLERQGFVVTYLTPDSGGLLHPDQLISALREDTILVSIMQVNNEIGVIQDIASMAAITSDRGILLHVDAAQSAGKIAIDVTTMPVDLLSFSAHKMYGPKGMGVLYLRKKPRVRLAPQFHGGGQEGGMRSGTLPVHQIVGIGEACDIAKKEMEADYKKMTELQQVFWKGIQNIKNVFVNGNRNHSSPYIFNVRFSGMKSEDFMRLLPEMAVSSGSACHAKGVEPSLVLRALGQTREEAECAIRFSLGRFTTSDEIQFAIDRMVATMPLSL